MNTTTVVFNKEQHVQPAQQHRVDVEEVDRQDALSLGSEEPLPCRSRSARCRVQACTLEDRPYRRCRDRVPQPDEFTVDSPVAPPWVVPGHLQHQPADPCRDRRAPWSASTDPPTPHQRGVPSQDRPWRHDQRQPTPARHQPHQRPITQRDQPTSDAAASPGAAAQPTDDAARGSPRPSRPRAAHTAPATRTPAPPADTETSCPQLVIIDHRAVTPSTTRPHTTNHPVRTYDSVSGTHRMNSATPAEMDTRRRLRRDTQRQPRTTRPIIGRHLRWRTSQRDVRTCLGRRTTSQSG